MKTIIRYLLSIILAIVIIAYFFINLASSTILNEQYVLSKLDENDYYDKIYEQVKSNFENYIYQSGLEETVLENIVTKEKVKKDTIAIINNLYDGLGQEIDTSEIRENLNKNIENTLGTQKLTTAQKKSVDTFVDYICKEYTSTMSHFSFEGKVSKAYTKIMKYIDLAKKALLVVIGVGFILLILLCLRRIYKSVCLTGVSLTISGLVLLVVDFFVNSKIKVGTITILNDSVSEVIRNVLSGILATITRYGWLSLVCGIILIIAANLIHYMIRYKHEGNNEEDETYEEN